MFHSNGRSENTNSLSIDGLSFNFRLAADESATPTTAGDTFARTASGGTDAFVSLDGASEFEVKAWPYTADAARTSGRQILVTTKAGTNNFHGSLFENFGNSHLNANDWLANSRGIRKPASQANNFGASFGGPIQRNKHFFFLTYEGLRLRQASFALTDVPSLIARNNAPSNIRPLLKAFPFPTGPARGDGFAESARGFTNPATTNTASLRLDFQINDKLRLNGRYSYANSFATTRGDDGFSLNTLKRTDSNVQTINEHAIYVPSAYVVLDFASNYSRVALGESYGLDNFGGANVTTTDARALFAGDDTFSKFDLYGRNAALASGDKIEGKLEQFNFVTSATIIKGNHTIKAGFDYRRLWLVTGAQPTERDILFDGIDGTISATTARINLISRTGPHRPYLSNFSAYAQDNWKISPRFTFDFGTRWDVSTPPSISEEEQSPLALTNNRLPFNVAPQGTPLWHTTYNNFAPRISFAYQPGDDGRNLIRVGVGWFYDYGNTDAIQTFVHSSPFANGTVAFNQPLSSNNQTPNKIFIGYDPNLKLPLVRQWSLMFLRELSSSITLSATYSGAQGSRLHLTRTFVDQDPEFAFARLTTNEGESSYQSFQLRFQTSSVKGFNSLLLYNFSKSLDNFSPDTIQRAIVVSPNAQLDHSYSDADARHTLSGYVSYSAPREFENKTASRVLRNWTFTSLLNLRSALPLNVVYSRVNGFGISYFRPDMVQGAQIYLRDSTIGDRKRINAAAFIIPSTERQGTSARNSLRAFPFYQVDLSASRKFSFTNDINLTVRLSAVNVFNHPNFAAPSGFDRSLGTLFPNGVFLANSTFGQSSSLHIIGAESAVGPRFLSAYQPDAARSLQLSFRLSF